MRNTYGANRRWMIPGNREHSHRATVEKQHGLPRHVDFFPLLLAIYFSSPSPDSNRGKFLRQLMNFHLDNNL